MNSLQRKTAPKFNSIQQIDIIPSKISQLSNGIPVHTITGGSQDVLKFDFIFQAGTWYQPSALVASFTNSMLNEGTTNFSAAEIAEKFDFYGAYISFNTGVYNTVVSLYTLSKYADKTLQITEDIIKNSIFPEKEFQTILLNRKQRYIVEHEKTNVQAKDKFNEILYGKNHPYANNVSLQDYNNIKIENLKEFYRNKYTYNNCKIIVSGKINTTTNQLLEKYFGSSKWKETRTDNNITHKIELSACKETFIHKPDAVQASIRIGRPILPKNHPQYPTLQLFNLILGGYFGSRLMKNIREDKGYTYGIYSMVVAHKSASHFCIISDVGNSVCSEAIKEIYSEIQLLQEQPVSAEELLLVKNYFVGDLLRHLDNPFALSESLKNNLLFDNDNTYYQKLIQKIQKVTAEDIQNLAQTYFNTNDLCLVICGENIAKKQQ